MSGTNHTALASFLLGSMVLATGCTEVIEEARPSEVRLRGTQARERAGSAVGPAGDVNGDGRADLFVSAPGPGEGSPSRVYVLTGPFEADATLDEVAGFSIVGEADVDFVGGAVGIGDVNGDGLDDLLVNSVRPLPEFDGCYHDCPPRPPYEGELRAFVVFGKGDRADVSLADVAAGRGGGFVIEGNREEMGWLTLSPVGDLDGDGRADFAIGAPMAGDSATGYGRAYVVFGRDTTTPLDLDALGASERGFVIEGDAEGTFGRTLVRAGDVNGDGLDDLLIGSEDYFNDQGELRDRVYVVFGKASMDRVTTADLRAGRAGFVIEAEANGGYTPCCTGFGLALAGGGDIDGDGLDDLVVGAPSFRSGEGRPQGRLYVVYGRTETTPVLASEVARGVGGYAITGGDEVGRTLSSLQDLDGDGRADILTTDYEGDLLFYTAAAPTEAERFTPETEGSWYLSEGTSVGDLDGDGTSDLVLVNAGYETESPGEVLIVFR
jgi:hypothetical protein